MRGGEETSYIRREIPCMLLVFAKRNIGRISKMMKMITRASGENGDRGSG